MGKQTHNTRGNAFYPCRKQYLKADISNFKDIMCLLGRSVEEASVPD
jgi:hypothetical protein